VISMFLSGRGSFWLDSPQNSGAFEPGHLLFFKKGVVHALPHMYEEPIVFLSVDTPRRDPKDIYFGARFERIRCKVRRCMFKRRAVSETLRPHNS
jgi:hypothetical protein